MHAAAIHLMPILGEAKSKLPFYVAGGVLIVWALFVSLGLGLRNEGFPGSAVAERAVMGVTVLLVAAAVAMAIATAG